MTSQLKHRHVYPVFRSDPRQSRINETSGITLRQYYAGLAMQGLLVEPLDDPEARPETHAMGVAAAAVRYADALCEELAKQS